MSEVIFKPLLDAVKRAKKEGRTIDPHGLPIVLVYDDLKKAMEASNGLTDERPRIYPNIVLRGTIIKRSNYHIHPRDLVVAIADMTKTIDEANYQVKPIHEAIRSHRESILKKIEDVLLTTCYPVVGKGTLRSDDESAEYYLHELTASLIRFSTLIKEHYSSDISSKLP